MGHLIAETDLDQIKNRIIETFDNYCPNPITSPSHNEAFLYTSCDWGRHFVLEVGHDFPLANKLLFEIKPLYNSLSKIASESYLKPFNTTIYRGKITTSLMLDCPMPL